MKTLTNWFESPFKLIEALSNLWRGPIPSDVDATAQNVEKKNPSICAADTVVANAVSPVETNILPVEVETNIGAEKSGDQNKTEVASAIPLAHQDDESRRKLIRALFNDFWTDAMDKPATFVERLDAAEDYINGQLAERCLGWRLDALTRTQLGLPISMSSRLVAEVDMNDMKAPKRNRSRRTARARN